MKRSEFFKYITENVGKDEQFNMVYLKKNGERREAECTLCNEEVDKSLKGTGMTRHEKMNRLQVFQYFDLNSNAYRSARLENIQNVTIKGEVINLEAE